MSYGATNRQTRSQEFTPLNRVQPSWWHRHGEEVGLLLWMVAILIGSCALIMTLDKVLAWFR